MEKKIKEIKKNEGTEPCSMLLQKWLIIHRCLSYSFGLCLEEDFDQKNLGFSFVMWEDECQRFHFHINLIPKPGLYLRTTNGTLNTT